MRSLQCPRDEEIRLGRGRIESAPALTAVHSRQSLRPSRVYLSWVLQAGKQPSDCTNWEEKPHIEPLQLGDPLDSGPRQLSAIRIHEEHATPVPVLSLPKSTQECIGFVHLRVNVSVLVLVTQSLQLPESLAILLHENQSVERSVVDSDGPCRRPQDEGPAVPLVSVDVATGIPRDLSRPGERVQVDQSEGLVLEGRRVRIQVLLKNIELFLRPVSAERRSISLTSASHYRNFPCTAGPLPRLGTGRPDLKASPHLP